MNYYFKLFKEESESEESINSKNIEVQIEYSVTKIVIVQSSYHDKKNTAQMKQ